MTPDEIVSELRELHRESLDKVQRMQTLSQILYKKARRQGNDNTPVYVAYANTWIRYSAVSRRGLDRTSNSDRLLEMLKAPKPEATVKVAPKSLVPTSPVESLMTSYRNYLVADTEEPESGDDSEVDVEQLLTVTGEESLQEGDDQEDSQ